MPKFIIESLADGLITVRLPNSNYQNTFTLKSDAAALTPGERVRAVIHAPAWKVDRVDMGGNYVEPLYGRPRRMQGTILSINPATNELTVQVGYEVTVALPPKYNAADYAIGERVGWDNIEIPTLEITAPIAVPTAAPAL